MNIMMLGHSGVGKTTYMASMYSALQKPIDGFGLRSDNHCSLLGLHSKIIRGGYPDPSDQRKQYEFVLTYQREDVFPFTWIDYRGGALNEHRSQAQTQEVLYDLKGADGILVFADGQALAQKRGASNQIGRMTALLGQTISEAERPLPLTLIVTKADLIGELTDEMLTPLTGLADAIAASSKVIGTLIPVACGQEPQNVQLPLLFTLNVGILSQFHKLNAIREYHVERMNAFSERIGFLDDVVSFVFSEPTYRELAQRELNETNVLYERLKVLLEPVKALETYLEDLDVF